MRERLKRVVLKDIPLVSTELHAVCRSTDFQQLTRIEGYVRGCGKAVEAPYKALNGHLKGTNPSEKLDIRKLVKLV